LSHNQENRILFVSNVYNPHPVLNKRNRLTNFESLKTIIFTSINHCFLSTCGKFCDEISNKGMNIIIPKSTKSKFWINTNITDCHCFQIKCLISKKGLKWKKKYFSDLYFYWKMIGTNLSFINCIN
jgi:hypothetical protein